MLQSAVHLLSRLGFACHNIVPAGFISMYKPKRGQTLAGLVGALMDDIQQSAGVQVAEGPAAMASNAFVLPDLPVSKIQGVRARKGAAWFGRDESATEMVVAIAASRPVERVTAWMLKAQKDESWLAADPGLRPLVQLVTPGLSCCVQALCEYASMMSCLPADLDVCQVLDGGWAFKSVHADSHPQLTRCCMCFSRLG